MEVRKTVPTSRPVAPSITVVPDTRVVTFQVCGGTSGRAARRSMRTNAASSTAEAANAARARTESKPCAEVLARPYIRAARPPMTVRAPGRSNWAQVGAGGDVLGEDLEPEGEGDDADGDVDPEDELPAGPGGQCAAEQDACGDAEASDRTPQGEAPGALRAGVGGHHEGQRGGGHQRRTEPLGGAGGDEFGGVAGEPADQGGAGEDGHAGEEHAAARQQVGDPAAEQQAAAGEQQVGGDEPLQVAAAQAQRLPDGRQCGVDDGDVQDDQDLGGEGEGEDGPRGAQADGRAGRGGSGRWRRHDGLASGSWSCQPGGRCVLSLGARPAGRPGRMTGFRAEVPTVVAIRKGRPGECARAPPRAAARSSRA